MISTRKRIDMMIEGLCSGGVDVCVDDIPVVLQSISRSLGHVKRASNQPEFLGRDTVKEELESIIHSSMALLIMTDNWVKSPNLKEVEWECVGLSKSGVKIHRRIGGNEGKPHGGWSNG